MLGSLPIARAGSEANLRGRFVCYCTGVALSIANVLGSRTAQVQRRTGVSFVDAC